MAGKTFEELTIGAVFEHEITRTITETDNLLFSAMTHNPQPLHIDAEFARKSQHGQILVNSLYTLGLVIGISVGETTLGTTIGNLGMVANSYINVIIGLAVLYVNLAIYNFVYSIIAALVNFIPKFAIPLAIRNKEEK